MIKVREARESDLFEAVRIFREVRRAASWGDKEPNDNPNFLALIEGEKVFVSTNEKHIVTGFVSVSEPEAFIHHLYVDLAYHRCGIGTALLASLSSWLPRPWTLKCVESNETALRFYRCRGWKEVDGGVGGEGPYLVLRY